jgi:hypothetical protein
MEENTEQVQEAVSEETAPESKVYMTQEEVDRVVAQRLARDRKEVEQKLSAFDEMKAKAEQFDELQAEQKTELEKLIERAEKAEREREEIAKRADQQAIRSALVAEASRQGAIDPDDVVALLASESFTIDPESGKVEDADERVKALVESKPHLFGSRTPQPADQGVRATAPNESLDPAAELGAKILKAARK